jgi:hypothetical protein
MQNPINNMSINIQIGILIYLVVKYVLINGLKPNLFILSLVLNEANLKSSIENNINITAKIFIFIFSFLSFLYLNVFFKKMSNIK